VRKILTKFKWPLLVLINALPFLLNVVCFKIGAMDDLYMFLPIFLGLTALNFKNCNKITQFIALQSFILMCVVLTGYAGTYLYYHNVSSDSLTPMIGMGLVLLQVVAIIIITTIIAIVKRTINVKQKESNR